MVVPHVTQKHNYYVSRGQSNSMWPFQDNILAAHGQTLQWYSYHTENDSLVSCFAKSLCIPDLLPQEIKHMLLVHLPHGLFLS